MADNSRVRELTRALEVKTKEIQTAAEAFKIDDDGNVEVTTEVKDAYLRTLGEAKEIKALIEAEREVSGLQDWLTAPAGGSVAGADAVDAQRGMVETKTLGELLTDSQEYKAQRSSPKPFIQLEIDDSIANLARKDVYGTSAGRTGGDVTLPALGRVQALGITETRLRQKHVRDLFPTASTDAAVLYGLREVGYVNNAAAVPVRSGGDFGLKPTSNIDLQSVVYPVATINFGRLAA
jgi:hypothetical protein